MFEDLIVQLDELGVSYLEDAETGVLDIDVGSMDKAVLIDVIIALNDGGYTFDITESSIIVEGYTEPTTDTETYDEEAYLDDAFAQM